MINIDSEGILAALRVMRQEFKTGKVAIWTEVSQSEEVRYVATWESPVGMCCHTDNTPDMAVRHVVAESRSLVDTARNRLAEMDEKRSHLLAMVAEQEAR